MFPQQSFPQWANGEILTGKIWFLPINDRNGTSNGTSTFRALYGLCNEKFYCFVRYSLSIKLVKFGLK